MKWEGIQYTGREVEQGFSGNPSPTLAQAGIDRSVADRTLDLQGRFSGVELPPNFG
jgi:hypothetical protein